MAGKAATVITQRTVSFIEKLRHRYKMYTHGYYTIVGYIRESREKPAIIYTQLLRELSTSYGYF